MVQGRLRFVHERVVPVSAGVLLQRDAIRMRGLRALICAFVTVLRPRPASPGTPDPRPTIGKVATSAVPHVVIERN
ncbi:hypothetical protein MTO96_016780 [Rhipicephalus appendiculatus]